MTFPFKCLSSLGLIATLAACGGGAAAPAASPSSAALASSAAAKPAASVAASASAKPAASTASSAKPAASGAASAKPAASGSAAAQPAASGTGTKIVTATGVPSVVFTPVWIAAEQGLFTKYGLNVEVQENLEGVKQAQAIIAGDVQIGNVGGAEILNSQVGGAKLEGILQTTASPLFELHAAPTFKKVEDFKGKTVAITATGSSTDLAARVLFKNHGLEPDKDVKLLQASNMPGIVAAMVSKNVDGGVVSPPTTVKANDAGFPMVASAIDEKVPLQNNLTAVLKSYADAHPDVVTAYLKAELEAEAYFLKQPDATVKIIAKHTQSDDNAAKAAYDAMKPAIDLSGLVTEAGLKTIQDYGPNPQTKNVALAGTYDNSFLQKIKDSGFYDQIGLK